jgi:hypothetical protein
MDTIIYSCKRIEDQRAVCRALQDVGFLLVLQVEGSLMLCLDPEYLGIIAANFSRFAHPL